MTGDALELVLPMPPNLVNPRSRGSRNGRQQNREKKAYWQSLDILASIDPAKLAARDLAIPFRIPRPPSRPFERATLRSVMHLGHEMDEDNAVIRHKWPIDWLRTRGYVANDTRQALRWEAFPEQIVKRDGNYRLHITLTPLGAA